MKQCLVIDDSEIIRKIATQLVAAAGLEASEADSGQSAIEHCQKSMPDAILLDWHLPAMSGIDLISSLRMQPDGTKPVIVYCTTENDPVDIARALAAGADEYILKPYDSATIRAKFTEAGLM